MIKQETLEKAIARQALLARAIRAAMKALGLKIFAQAPSDVVTSVCVPEGIDGAAMVKSMRADYGVSIAGGQAQLKGKIFRIASMGYMNEFDIITGISCLELVLAKMGYEFQKGVGVGAAENELLK